MVTVSDFSKINVSVVDVVNGFGKTESDELFSANSFTSTTTLPFNLEKPESVTITIYDVTVRKIKSVLTEKLSSGKQEIKIDAKEFTTGIYFCEVKTLSQSFKTKLIIQ